MSKLAAMDLFSGIGGLTIGTDNWCDAKLLCDVNPDCRALLVKRFPDTPIKDDVTTLCEELGDNEQFDIIAGGFPCKYY